MNIMRQNSMLAIMTLGMTVVILSGESTLSVVALGGVVAAMLAGQSSWQSSAALQRHLARCGKRSSRVPRELQPFVVTLFTARLLRGLALASPRSRLRYHRQPRDLFGWAGFIGPIPVPVFMVAPVFRSLVHAAQEPIRVAHVRGRRQRGGLPAHGREPGPVKLAAYTISGLLSGLAGVVLAGRLGAGQPVAALGWETDGRRHGGTFSEGGAAFPTLAGVLLLGMMLPAAALLASGRSSSSASRRGSGGKETWIAVKATSSDFFPPMECFRLRSRQDPQTRNNKHCQGYNTRKSRPDWLSAP